MSTIIDKDVTAVLRRAAVRATYAPSVHNTQPWRFVLHHGALDIYADATRHLRVLDPRRQHLTVSVGCALFNSRVTLAASGYAPTVLRIPGPDASLMARVTAEPTPTPDAVLGAYDAVVEKRQTSRRRFTDQLVPDDVVAALVQAAQAEDSVLSEVRTDDDRLTISRLSQQADRVQVIDPAYRNELRKWTTTDLNRRDGVQAMAVPHVDGTAQDDVPIRDFDSSGSGWLPSQTGSSRNQCLLLLGTREDDVRGWLRAGEALQRVWLEATQRGYAVGPLTQIVEVPATRTALIDELRIDWYPVALLRIGKAPISPTSLRRPLADVLTEDD